MQTPRKLLRAVFAETNDAVVAIRAVRERFGLTLDEAKTIWLEATGKPVLLTEQEGSCAALPLRIVCPKCRSPDSIERKVHALPSWLAYTGSKAVAAPGPRFVNGFWCNACGVGFVPDHLIGDFGLVAVR